MKQIIYHFFSVLLLLSFALSIYGQEDYLFQEEHDVISFRDLVDLVEDNSDITFFFADESIDSLMFTNIRRGNNLASILTEGLKSRSLNFFRAENDIYIFHGDPIIAELPVYEDHSEIKRVVPEVKEEASMSQYIESINQPGDNVITVGREQKAVHGRKCKVTGMIRSKSNGEVLIGATVYIKKLELGTITDVDGVFTLRIPPGQYAVTIDHMAMKAKDYQLEVISDGAMTIELEDDLIELQEITVVDKRRSNVEGMLMGFERITTKSMKEIPAVLGEKDILKVAQMLPGVQNVGEGSSGFNVRGGSADQNMFYINNISVYNTSHLFGFFTSFSPDIISDFSLYKNNVPAKYGGRIASVFEINTREGNKSNYFAQGGISLITGHVSVEGPIVKEKVTFVSSLRSSYSDWLLKRIQDNDISKSNASFYDGTLGVNADINEKNQVKVFYYHSSDKFSLSTKNDYSYTNSGVSLSWKHNYSDALSSNLSLSSSHYEFGNIDKNNVSEAYAQDYSLKHHEARADFLFLGLDKHRFEFGLNSILYQLDRGDILPFGEESKRIPINLGLEHGLENSLYISDEFTLSPRLSLLLGLRYSYYTYLGPSDVNLYEEGQPRNKYTVTGVDTYAPWEVVKPYSGIEPRAALNYRLAQNTSVKASYNRLQQYIFLLSNTIALSPTDQWKLTDYHSVPPVSDQVSLGFYHDFTDEGINFSIEGYKKWINNIVEYKDGVDFISGEPIERQTLQGYQNSRGIEVMVKKTTNHLTGWLTYTYSRSTVTVDNDFEEMRINGGLPYPSNYDRPHSFSLVANYRLSRRVSLSSNVVYISGRPVTLPVAVYYSEMRQYLYYSDRNEYRIPDYFRIDFSVNLEGNLKFKKLAHSYWMLNIYNLTGRDNAYSIFYEARNGYVKGYKLSIFAQPIITISWNFKFGNYNSD